MTNTLDIEGVKRFHGHSCRGLAMGIRVAELALQESGPHAGDEEVADALVRNDAVEKQDEARGDQDGERSARGDVEDLDAAVPWLRIQWIGIAFAPAAYLDFSNALLICEINCFIARISGTCRSRR